MGERAGVVRTRLRQMFRDPEWSSARKITAWNAVSAVVAFVLIAWLHVYAVPLLLAVFTLSSTFAVGLTEQENRRG